MRPYNHLRPTLRLAIAATLAAALPLRGSAGQSPAAPSESIIVAGCRVTFVDEVAISSERRGIVAAIARPGDRVDAGQDVARLRDSVLKAGLAIAQREAANDVEVRFAQKAAELAELKFQWAAEANGKNAGTVSEQELKELRLASDRAVLQCEQANNALAIARLKLAEMSVTVESLHLAAPFAGRVRAVYMQPGEFVQEGEVLAEIVNADRVRVEGDVPLTEAGRIVPGAPVEVRIEGVASPSELAHRTFSGAITFVDVKVEPVSQKVHVAAELDNRHGLLRGGLVATMMIPRATAPLGAALSSALPK